MADNFMAGAAKGVDPKMAEAQMQKQQAEAAEDQRQGILDQILEPAAKDRLKRIALVKKEMARSVEDSFIMAAKNGRLPGKVSEEQLIAMMDRISGSDIDQGAVGKRGITVQRKNYGMDDDDDDDNDDDLL